MPLPQGLEEYEPISFGGEHPELNATASLESRSQVAAEQKPLVTVRANDAFENDSETEASEGSGMRRPLGNHVTGRRPVLHGAVVMITFLTSGVAFAVGHHAYNKSLSGHPVDAPSDMARWSSITSQTLALRVQTVFVFLTKTFFTGTISMAFMQRFWVTANRKAIGLQGLDAMFSAINDPFALLTWDFVRNGKLLALLAITAWLISLASIPVPSSLTVTTRTTPSPIACAVPHIDLGSYNRDVIVSYVSLDPIGFFRSSSLFAQTIAIDALARGSYVTWKSPCGPNCTYSASFWAPWYNCSVPAVGGVNNVLKWTATDWQNMVQDNMTIQWANGVSTTSGYQISSTTCFAWNATYDILVSYSNGVQEIAIKSVIAKGPIALGPSLSTTVSSNSGISNPRIPLNDVGLASLVGVKDAFTRLLAGWLSNGPTSGYMVNETMVGYSTMVVNNASIYFPDVPWGVQTLSENVSLSLMANSPTSPLNTTCLVTSTEVVWQYDPILLWASYGSIVFVSAAAACIGLYSMFVLGGTGNGSFSLLVATTRNPELDDVFAVGSQDEGQKTLMRQRFRYDALDEARSSFAFRLVSKL